MAIYQMTIGVRDSDGDHGYTGATLEKATAPDWSTYIAAVNGASDGVVDKLKSITVTAYSGNPAGTCRVERVGNVVVVERAHPKNKWALQIPAIAESAIEKPSGKRAVPRVSDATVTALLAAFATASGIAVADFDIVDNFISQRKS